MGRKAQWGIIIGLWLLSRIVAGIGDSNPELEPYLTPLLYLYIVGAVLSWTIDAIFNLVMRFNRYGRYALNEGQIISSNLVAVFISLSVLYFLLSFQQLYMFTKFGALAIFAMILPVSGTYDFYGGPRFKGLYIYTTVLTVLLAIGLSLNFLAAGGGNLFFALVVLGMIAFTWIANFMTK